MILVEIDKNEWIFNVTFKQTIYHVILYIIELLNK